LIQSVAFVNLFFHIYVGGQGERTSEIDIKWKYLLGKIVVKFFKKEVIIKK
jgi:hypothetical protein